MSSDHPFSLRSDDQDYVIRQAYVPEHIPDLMVAISEAEPFFVESYLGYAKDNWIIFVGYPLEGQFDAKKCITLVERIKTEFKPDIIWFIGPEIPASFKSSCRARQSDRYYYLDLAKFAIKSSLRRQVKRAAKKLVVEQSSVFGSEHQSLVNELMNRQKLPALISELYQSMPDYIANCETALLLDARDDVGNLSAFFVVETAAEKFDTYLLGCHSKVNYIPHASDLLFAEMIALAEHREVPGINLGLGVNPGIRRFKQKWGGKAFLEYQYCELYFGPPEQISVVNLLLGGEL